MTYRVSDFSGYSLGVGYFGQEPRNHDAIAADVDAAIQKADDIPPVDTLKRFLALQQEIRGSEKAYPADANKFKSLRFTISRATLHLYSSLTPDGKKSVHSLVKEVTHHTPSLKEALRKEHWRRDELVTKLALPKGTVHPGLHLGQQKRKLGLSPEEEGRRRSIIAQLRARARSEGRVLKQEEIREILDARKPVPSRHVQKLKEPPRATPAKPAVPTPGIPGAKPATPAVPSKKALAGYYGFGWLGQDSPQVDAFTSQAEAAFRAGDADTQAAIMDKVADVRSALDSSDEGVISQDQALNVAAGGEFPWMPVVIGVGVVGVLGFLIYTFTKR